jgi:hypothetical protein
MNDARQQQEDDEHQQWLADRAAQVQHSSGSTTRRDEDTMKIGDMIESKYLRQQDVTEETLVTIRGLKKVNVARDDEDPEYRWTIKFDEFPKPIVANVTNLKRLAKALGDDTDSWIGGQVVLYTDPDIEFGGNVVGGLRVRAAKNKVAKRPLTEDEVNRRMNEADDSVPF